MAKGDWLSLLDADPDSAWKSAGKTKKDPTEKRRTKLLEGIERAIGQLRAGDEKPARGWYVTKGDRCRVTIKAGNKIIPISGRDYNTVPTERAMDFYSGALAHARSGGLDADMNATYDNAGTPSAPAGKRADAGKKRAGWSPERRARQAASIAARKAKPPAKTAKK